MRMVLALASALMLVTAPAQTAAAAGDAVEFSADGSAWTVEPRPLFADDIVLVPGDSAERSLSVRSPEHGGALALALVRTGATSSAAASAFGITAAAGSTTLLERTSLDLLDDCTPLLSRDVLPGASVDVRIGVDLAASVVGTAVQGESMSFALRVVASDASEPDACSADGTDIPFVSSPQPGEVGALPRTGAVLQPAVVVTAAIAMLLGVLLLLAAPRRRRQG